MVLVLLSAERGWFVLLRVCSVRSCVVVLFPGVVSPAAGCVGIIVGSGGLFED